VTGNFTSNLEFADREKKRAFVDSITNGKFHNQAAEGSESAISCILARTAAYKNHEITWDDIMKSSEVLEPGIDLDRLR
jgi:myo-inositol 2-dehydrogenase/D-chiro-inositol 1-dehydrogenase